MQAERRQLNELLKSLQGVVVAFSGGVDSSVLLAAGHEALGDSVLAVTGTSASLPAHDLDMARMVSSCLGVRWVTLESGELADPRYSANPSNRCYYCKTNLYKRLLARASEERLPFVVEGSTADDLQDYRPGIAAARELGIRSPFLELGIGKEMIRRLARSFGLPNWDKPSSPCLASRIPYGELITPERLQRIGRSESLLREMGFRQLRVRDHGTLARVELSPEDIVRLVDPGLREAIASACESVGYTFVTVDLRGYRTGAMNVALAGISAKVATE
ncbi:MAG: ATP-dependent sacrificial sulfur transferase LarE [Syntrophobacter sp.]